MCYLLFILLFQVLDIWVCFIKSAAMDIHSDCTTSGSHQSLPHLVNTDYCLFSFIHHVVLMCISLLSNDIEHLFLCLSTMSILLWNVCSTPFLIFSPCFCLLLSWKRFIDILDTWFWLDIGFIGIFSHSVVFFLSWWCPLKHKSNFYNGQFNFFCCSYFPF